VRQHDGSLLPLTVSVPHSRARTRPIRGIEHTLVVVYRRREFGHSLAASPRKKEERPASREDKSRDEERTFQSTIDRARDPREKRDSRRRRNYPALATRRGPATTTRWTTGKENPRGKRTTVDPASNKQDKRSPPSWLLAIPQGGKSEHRGGSSSFHLARFSSWTSPDGEDQESVVWKLSIAKRKELGDPVASCF